jgi:hypothetical protein
MDSQPILSRIEPIIAFNSPVSSFIGWRATFCIQNTKSDTALVSMSAQIQKQHIQKQS